MPNITPIRRGFGHCTVPGCANGTRSSVSPLCTKHHSQARVHGDPQQTLVTRPELRPYENRVRKVIATGKQDLIVSSLKEITRRLAEYAQAELARFHRGQAVNRHLITACDQIEKVTKSVDSIETATTIAAMFLLRDQQSRRFASDQGFIGQTVRQFRLPSGIARGTTYDQRTDKTVGWFRPLSRKATEQLGRIIIEAYKPWLVHIHAAEKRLTEEEQRVSRDLTAAFAA